MTESGFHIRWEAGVEGMTRVWNREQSQGGEVGECTKPGTPWERWPRCGGSQRVSPCLGGEVMDHKLGAWGY